MRVWIIGNKRWGNSDERQWSVEWQTPHPDWQKMSDDERADMDPAEHPFRCKTFPADQKDDAIKYAEQVVGESVFGCVHVQMESLEQVDGNAYDWEPVGELIEV